MHSIPADLPLERFLGHDLAQICLGEHQLQLRFHPSGSISIEGHWELHDQAGALVDSAQEHRARESYRIHRLLSTAVVRASVAAPHSFTLFFASGLALTLFDDSKHYETIAMEFDGQPGIYI